MRVHTQWIVLCHCWQGQNQAGFATKGGIAVIATDLLSLVFIFCFVLGFGFFLVLTFAGGHGHAGHAGHAGHVHLPSVHHAPVAHGAHAPAHGAHAPAHGHANSQHQAQAQEHFALGSILNPTSIAIFLLGFGFFGYFLHNLTPVAVSLSVFLAVLGGLVLAAVLLTLLNYLFSLAESATEIDVVDRTGMIGRVSLSIPEGGLGEVIYTSPGGLRKSIPARSLEGQRLARDLEVVVVNYQSGVAEVDTWEHFMHGHAAAPSPAEQAHLRELLDFPAEPMEMEMLMRQDRQQD
jgi:hypothetical protein